MTHNIMYNIILYIICVSQTGAAPPEAAAAVAALPFSAQNYTVLPHINRRLCFFLTPSEKENTLSSTYFFFIY